MMMVMMMMTMMLDDGNDYDGGDDDDGDRGGEVEFQIDQASVVGQVQVVADQLLALLRLARSTGLEESFIETGVKCQRDVLCRSRKMIDWL